MRPKPVDDSLDDPEALMLSESTLNDKHFQPLKGQCCSLVPAYHLAELFLSQT